MNSALSEGARLAVGKSVLLCIALSAASIDCGGRARREADASPAGASGSPAEASGSLDAGWDGAAIDQAAFDEIEVRIVVRGYDAPDSNTRDPVTGLP